MATMDRAEIASALAFFERMLAKRQRELDNKRYIRSSPREKRAYDKNERIAKLYEKLIVKYKRMLERA